MTELEKSDHGETGEPATKRARLESVVPAPALAAKAGGQTAAAAAKTSSVAAMTVRTAAANTKVCQQRQWA
jgi:hypothetical protein